MGIHSHKIVNSRRSEGVTCGRRRQPERVHSGRKGRAGDRRRLQQPDQELCVCWNYLYLSQKLTRAETKEAKDHLLTAITTHSVISWAHITFRDLLGAHKSAGGIRFFRRKIARFRRNPTPKTGYIEELEVRRRQSSRLLHQGLRQFLCRVSYLYAR